MVEVYVGLGSNVVPERHLGVAVEALRREFDTLRLSSVWRSAAVGFAGDDFLNMVIGFSSDAGSDAVRAVLSAVERAHGRTRQGAQPGPRTLDLDLLLYGMRVDPARRLPRADILRYAFVLGPLVELAPDLIHPVTGGPFGEAWRAMQGSAARPQNLGTLASISERPML